MAFQRKSTFGQTWWGQQWIKVLEGLDQSGRLARGRTYANNGSVQSIAFEENKIAARVKGTSPRPYKIAFKIEPLSSSDKARLVSLIADNPLYLTQLLNRQLPSELYSDCQRKGIALFPRSWAAFHSDCSCPDWGDPCKHRAAERILPKLFQIERSKFWIGHKAEDCTPQCKILDRSHSDQCQRLFDGSDLAREPKIA